MSNTTVQLRGLPEMLPHLKSESHSLTSLASLTNALWGWRYRSAAQCLPGKCQGPSLIPSTHSPQKSSMPIFLFLPTTPKILPDYQTCSSCPQSHPLQSQRKWFGYHHCQLLWLKSDQQWASGWSHFPPHFLCCWTVSGHPREAECEKRSKWKGSFKFLLLLKARQKGLRLARGRLDAEEDESRGSQGQINKRDLLFYTKDLRRELSQLLYLDSKQNRQECSSRKALTSGLDCAEARSRRL